MLINRRATLVLGSAALLAAPAAAQEQRALRAVIPFPPGGSVDIVARILQPRLQEVLGATVVIDNRSGAGGMIGCEAVARAAPDGSTVVWGNIATHAINPAVYKNMPYDPVADFAPVVHSTAVEFMLAVHPSVPADSVAALMEQARRNPGRLTYASAGAGSLPHLLTEMVKHAAGGLDIVHVPYRGGGPLLLDLTAGHVSMAIADMAGLMPHVREGRLRAVAVAGPERNRAAPELPTIAETLPGVEGTAWHAVFAPARTPPDVLARLNSAVNTVLAEPAVQARMRAAGTEPVGGTPEALAAFQRTEIAKWAAIARAVGARVE